MDNTKNYSMKIGYPCIFSKTPKEAADNLFRLISKSECGFDEGTTVWVSIVAKMLSPAFDKQTLNLPGSKHDDEWWTETLYTLRTLLTKDS